MQQKPFPARKFFLITLLVTLFSPDIQAQFSRYIVRLKNKGGTPYSLSAPNAYLSQRAIDRRTRYSIAIDSTDLPVTPSYLTQIAAIPNLTLLNVSRWQNAVTIQTSSPAAITALNALPFVQSVNGIAARTATTEEEHPRNKFEMEEIFTEIPPARTERVSADYFNYGTNSFNEIHLHNGEFLHNIGLRGQGMQIALLDNGFNNYTALRAFDSARLNGQILGTWDFVAREQNVANDGSHGMNCFSTIAANIPGQFIGKAPKASFWLYQTEDNASEYPVEEFNWVCGAERADSAGADVISSSLGYYDFDNNSLNYTYSNMNGNTTIAAKGADLAAKKGLLVFNAAGNEGGNSWKFIITPADGDSVVAVGAVTAAGTVGGFSSYGPSSDGQVKPDIASVGVAAMIQTTGNTIAFGNGTSFACPNMAGLSTILWQAFPEFNNMKILQALRMAGHKAANPDDRVGYGIPNMKNAFADLLTQYAGSSASQQQCRITLNWNSKDVGAMKYEIERKGPADAAYAKVGELNAQAGLLLANRSYSFTNDLPNGSSGIFSYRIRQLIDTATASFGAIYIDTATVTISSACGNVVNPVTTEKVWVQPNPASGNYGNLLVETPYAIPNMPVAVFDAKGSMVLQLKESKTAGRKVVNIPISRLPAGKYYIKVWNGSAELGTVEWLRL